MGNCRDFLDRESLIAREDFQRNGEEYLTMKRKIIITSIRIALLELLINSET